MGKGGFSYQLANRAVQIWSEYCSNVIILVTKHLSGSIMRFYPVFFSATEGSYIPQKLLAQFCIWSGQVNFSTSSRYRYVKENMTSNVMLGEDKSQPPHPD